MPASATALEKPLPHNLDAERSVLGAILLDNEKLKAAAEKIDSGEFFLDQNRRLFRTMLALQKAQKPIDLVTLVEELHMRGELEAAGGPGYISTLMDGVPRVSNIAHYASIVHEKAQLRNLIHLTHAIQQQAIEAAEPFNEIYERAFHSIREIGAMNGNGHKRLRIVNMSEFITMSLPPKKFVLAPLLPIGGAMMIYAWRGVGKTRFTLEIAYSIATGQPSIFGWDIPERRRVLYVDGEMLGNEFQEWAQGIYLEHGFQKEEPGYWTTVTPDLQDNFFPKIDNPEHQRMIEDGLQSGEVLALDNISVLVSTATSKQSEVEKWGIVQDWILRLRHGGVSTIFLQHAGKNLQQLGTSSREHILHSVLNLRHPPDYQEADGLVCRVEIEKARSYGAPEKLYPFELRMQTDHRGAVLWTRRPLKDVLKQQAAEFFKMGMKVKEIAEDLHISRQAVYRILDELGLRKKA